MFGGRRLQKQQAIPDFFFENYTAHRRFQSNNFVES